jgi:formylglycine-generating enzyme
MKKIIIFAFCFLLFNFLNALGTLRVESINELPATHMNLEVRDADGKFAPVLLVKTNLKGLGIQNIGRPTKHAPEYSSGDHHYKFYMNDNQRVVKITHADYEALEVRILADFGINVKAQRVYELTLAFTKEVVQVPVIITCNQNGAEVFVDDKLIGKTQNKMLTINIGSGSRKIKITKDGFETKEINKTISVENNSFNFLLQEIEPVLLTIKSNPTGASVSLDGASHGVTNCQPFMFPGTYKLKISLNKYETIEKNITVSESGNNTFSYNLFKITSQLKVNVTPSNATILINNTVLNGNSKEVGPGKYKIEVEKDGYFSDSKTITVIKGQNKNVNFDLVLQTGKLQVTVNPMEAKVTMKQNSSTYKSWNGSKYLKNIPVGEYTLNSSLTGYESVTKRITITLDKTSNENIILEVDTSNHSEGQVHSEGFDNMIFVKGGSFQMGSNKYDDEKPVHSVTVSDFYIGKYEVTQAEWQAIMGKNPGNFKGDNLPVEKVSWYDAVEFCNKKSRAEGLTPCYTGSGKNTKCNFSANGYRLPTEAEWEYAARGGVSASSTTGYKYAGSNNIGEVAWYYSNSNSKTHTVGTKQPNELGIYDMSGNVWEWCNDWYSKKYYKTSPNNNPQGASSGKYSVLRGGSWNFNDDLCRVANRFRNGRGNCSGDYGFRLVRAP